MDICTYFIHTFHAYQNQHARIITLYIIYVFECIKKHTFFQTRPTPMISNETLFPYWFFLFPRFVGVDSEVLLLMAEILHQLIGSLSHYLQGLYIPGGAGFLPSTVLNSSHWSWYLDQAEGTPEVPGRLFEPKQFDWNGVICTILDGFTSSINHMGCLKKRTWQNGWPGSSVIQTTVVFHSGKDVGIIIQSESFSFYKQMAGHQVLGNSFHSTPVLRFGFWREDGGMKRNELRKSQG